jgi:hypothetical protein
MLIPLTPTSFTFQYLGLLRTRVIILRVTSSDAAAHSVALPRNGNSGINPSWDGALAISHALLMTS